MTSKDLLPLSIASLIFALAEFGDSGGKIFVLTIRQSAFLVFATIAYKRFKKFKNYVEGKYIKKPNAIRFNFELYFYWYAKRVADHFSATIRKHYMKMNTTCFVSLLLYVAAPIALVVLFAIAPRGTIQTSDAFNNAIALFPLGLMFINVFFDSEFAYINKAFLKKVDTEVERLQKETDEFKRMMAKKLDV